MKSSTRAIMVVSGPKLEPRTNYLDSYASVSFISSIANYIFVPLFRSKESNNAIQKYLNYFKGDRTALYKRQKFLLDFACQLA